MTPRHIKSELQTQLLAFPIVTVLGPRQAGKTTLVRAVLPDYKYASLENPDTQALATSDPRDFLKQYPTRVIFNENQRALHLLSYLQGIERIEQVARDPLIGSLFENLIALEALKTRYNAGLTPNLYFFRDSQGHEIDLLHKRGHELFGIEIKSASTWHASFKRALDTFHQKVHPLAQQTVIYSGNAIDFSDGVKAVTFKTVAEVMLCNLSRGHTGSCQAFLRINGAKSGTVKFRKPSSVL